MDNPATSAAAGRTHRTDRPGTPPPEPPGAWRRRGLSWLAPLTAALLLGACDRARDTVPACALPDGATVLAIGDSLTRGHGADGAGYAEQLQALLAQTPGRSGVRVVNLGIDGERSAGLLARIDEAIGAHAPAVVLITTGGNDFLRRVDEQETRRNLREVVDRVRDAGAHPVVFGIPEPGLGAVVGVVGEHPMYGDLAEEAGVQVIGDVVADLLSQEALKADRIHPNRDGYARMAHAAFDALALCR